MIDRFDIQKLQDLPIEQVAEALGLEVHRHKCLCPFHNDSHPSLTFHRGRNRYRCFVCDAHGGTIDLVMRYLNKPFIEACKWLADGSSIILEMPHQVRHEGGPHSGLHPVLDTGSPESPKPFNASRYERFFARPWLSNEARRFLFEERHLDPRVIRWCRLTSWRDKQGTPWLQTPYYDRSGKLIGIQNRNLAPHSAPTPHSALDAESPQPRFKFPRGAQCSIYNLPVLNLLRPGETLFITEGCSDCWAMLSAGHKAIAIPSATLLTKKDVEQLSIINSQLSISYHMFPDQDEPGERLFLQLQKVLPNLVRYQLPTSCKDYSEYYLQSLIPHPSSLIPNPSTLIPQPSTFTNVKC